MKTVYSFLFAGFVLLLLGCKGHIKTITVSAKDGGVTFVKTNSQGKIDTTPQRHQQYLTKSDNLTIEVTGLTPNQTATIKATQSYQAITSEPQLKNPLSELPNTPSSEINEEAEEKLKTSEDLKDATISQLKTDELELTSLKAEKQGLMSDSANRSKTTEKQKKLDEKIAEKQSEIDKENKSLLSQKRMIDSLTILTKFNLGSQLYSEYYTSLFSSTTKEILNSRIVDLEKEIVGFYASIDSMDIVRFPSLNGSYRTMCVELNDLKNHLVNFSFTQKLEIFPYKERVDITVDLNTTKVSAKSGSTENTPVTSRIYTGEFITRRSFKMLVSAGFHTLISDGANVRNFANHDSTIVDRKGINVVPSFGTYLHATWRVQDALIGFGLGTGIPFSSDSGNDLTPNFSLFGTTMFQTDAGRMGFNIGVGLRKVNYLSPGYSVGDAISSDVTVIPTYGRWRPTLMVGVSYTIPEKEAN